MGHHFGVGVKIGHQQLERAIWSGGVDGIYYFGHGPSGSGTKVDDLIKGLFLAQLADELCQQLWRFHHSEENNNQAGDASSNSIGQP